MIRRAALGLALLLLPSLATAGDRTRTPDMLRGDVELRYAGSLQFVRLVDRTVAAGVRTEVGRSTLQRHGLTLGGAFSPYHGIAITLDLLPISLHDKRAYASANDMRLDPDAGLPTMVGGSGMIALSLAVPEVITPFAHGVPMKEVEPSLFAGAKQYKFMRAFFGMVVCTGIGVTVAMLTKPRPLDDVKGLVWGTVLDALAVYKGKAGVEETSQFLPASAVASDDDTRSGAGELLTVRLAPDLAEGLQAGEGDLVFVSDARAWLGGLRATHARVVAVDAALAAGSVTVGPSLRRALGVEGHLDRPLRIMRLY